MRFALFALPLLAACAAAPAACPAGLLPAIRAEALFGRNAAGVEVVDDAAWAGFLNDAVTPAFPDGLTVLDAAGQWRAAAGRVERERGKLLLLLLPGVTPAEAADRLAPIVQAYRRRFAQDSVLVSLAPSCLRF